MSKRRGGSAGKPGRAGPRRGASRDRAPGEFRPTKARGQNFLVDPGVARRFVELLDPGPEDTVLEVGPGKGALTEHLVERGCRVVAVEVEPALADQLEARSLPNLTLIRGDFLELPQEQLELPGGFLALSNVPYSITGPVLTRLMDWPDPPDRFVVGIQREVADRLAAGPGTKTYGSLSVCAAAFGQVQAGFKISAGCYRPRPKVESRAVLIRRDPGQERMRRGGWLDRVVAASFQHRRKTIANSLSTGLGIARPEAEAALEAAGIPPGDRAERVALAQFRLLAKLLDRGPINEA